MGLSLGHLLIILIIVLVLFGPGRVSSLMGDIGRGVKSLREGMKSDETDEAKDQPKKQITHQPSQTMSAEADKKKDSV